MNGDYLQHSDYADVYGHISQEYYINQYLEFLVEAKKKLSIPVIASINCSHVDSWKEYAKRFEAAGADGLELNYYPIASDASVSGDKVDKAALAFAKEARKATKLPVSIKIGCNYSSLANIIRGFEKEDIDGLVLFNRFYRPDIDIEKEEISSVAGLSTKNEYSESLRWIALMSAELPKIDFVASTGVQDGQTMFNMLLAGAKAVEVCSSFMKEGYEVVEKMLVTLGQWMEKKGYNSINDFCAKLAQEKIADGARWERTQYMVSINR